MITDQTPYEQSISESPEALWEIFEKTGSVNVYLRFVQKLENREDLLAVLAPTRA